MYPVTQDFLNKIKADKRKVDAKITIAYTDPFLDQSIESTANEQANVSYPEQTTDGISDVPHKWASLDGTWILDGSYHLAPKASDLNRYQMGWWGSQLASADNIFIAPFPTLTVTHVPRPIQRSKVVGDIARGEWPVDFSISLYDASDALIRNDTITGNTQINWSMMREYTIPGVAKQVLTITKWSHPGRQAKILEFFSSIQETYYNSDIVEIKLLEEREASQGSLPVGNITSNEISVRLANGDRKFDPTNPLSPLFWVLKPNRRIRAWLGIDEEWVPLGTYWALDWDTPDDVMEAQVRARDRLEILRKSTYSQNQVQQNVSLYTLAEQVLLDGGVQYGEYAIDTALQDIIVPWAWLPSSSHREVLRVICEAGLAVAYQDRDGIVRIEFAEDAGGTPALEVTADNYFPPLRAPSRQDQVANEIIVTTQPLVPVATSGQVYKSTTPIAVPAGQTITVRAQYSQPPVIEAVASLENPPAGVSITTSSYYGWGAEVGIENTGESEANVTLVVNGKPLSVEGGEQVIARDDTSIFENGTLRFEFPANPLVQTLERAQAIAQSILTSSKDPRRDYEAEWRGNPALELGDPVKFVGFDTRVIRQELNWAGALSGRITGRRTS